MNAVKQSFDRGCLRSDPSRGPLLVQKKKIHLKRAIAFAAVLATSTFAVNAQVTAPGCDLPTSTSGATGGGIGFNFGSVNNHPAAIDGDLNTKSTMAGFFSAGFGVNWTHVTNLNGLYTGDVFIKCGTEGSVFAANIAGNVTLTAFNGNTQVWQVNVGGTVASWGITIGNATTGIIPAPNTNPYNRIEVKLVSAINFSPIGDIFSVYEVRRVPFKPGAPAVSGTATISGCSASAATFNITAPASNLTYKWYNSSTGGSPLATGTSYTTPTGLSTGNKTYYVEAVAGNGCSFAYTERPSDSRSPVSVTVTACDTVKIAAKAFLRGAFNGTTRHKDVSAAWLSVLQSKALTQPYNTAAFGNYAGTESVTAATFTATAADNDVLDWVLLELKDGAGTLMDRRAALLLENGNIVSTDKVSPVSFKTLPGSYHLTIRHRNHLGLSTELIAFAAGNNTFDFTTATDATLFGTAAAFTTMNGKTLLIGGNANSNANVRYNGPANDRDAILAFLGANETGLTGNVYTAQDVNMDGTVRYNGPANDRDFLLLMLGANETGFISQQIK